jgi:trimeric autotransporter adhesin
MNVLSVFQSSRSVLRKDNPNATQTRSLLFLLLSSALFCLLALPAVGQNIITTAAGGGTVNGSALMADIPGPTGAITDSAGNLYVAAPFSQYVFELSTGGTVSQFAGTGIIAYFGTPGPANKRSLWNPYALAIDSHGNIYIADSGNNAIRMVDPSGNLKTVAGLSEPCDGTSKCGDGKLATQANLNDPEGVAVDAAGNLYIADTGDNRVRVVQASTGKIVAFAGNWNIPPCTVPTNPCGDGARAVNASFGVGGPIGVAVDGKGNVYIADSGDNRVRVVNTTTHKISAFAGSGNLCSPIWGACGDSASATAAQMGPPHGLGVDGAGNVYIADSRDNRIRLVKSGTISTFAGTTGGQNHGFAGDGGSPTSALLAAPSGVFVDGSGNVYISDTGNQRVREIKLNSNAINTILGGGNGGDSGPAAAAQFANPFAVALDSAGNYYIADTANNRIREVSGGNVSTVAGHGEANYSGENGPATSATLNGPEGVAVDTSGNIFIADSLNRRVREVTGGNISLFAGTGQPCTPSTAKCGDGGAAKNALLSNPTTVAVDSAGNIFIADPPTNRIREVSGGIMTTVAGTGTACAKATNPCGDGGLAINANLTSPVGVTVDSSENIYIADSGDNRIRCVLGVVGGCGDSARKYNVGDIVPYAYNGLEQFFQKEDGGQAIDAKRWNPTELALDAGGNLFVGGGNDSLVQRIDAATAIIVTVAGNDLQWWWYGFKGDGGSAIKARVDNSGLVIDGNENLFIADNGNNRIREVANLVPVVTLSTKSLDFGDVTVGQTSAPQQVTLQNTGSNDLSISSIVATGDFAQTNNCPTGSTTVAPSVSCTISVTFTPTKTGLRKGTLSITDNAPKSPQKVTLSGTGQ